MGWGKKRENSLSLFRGRDAKGRTYITKTENMKIMRTLEDNGI